MSNLTKRLLVAAIGIPVLLYSAVDRGILLYGVVIILQLGALWEWIRLCKAADIAPNAVGILVATAGLDALVFSRARLETIAGFVIAVSLMQLLDVLRQKRRPLRDLSAAILFVGYAAAPLALWSVLHDPPASARWGTFGPLAVLLVTTWVCDTAAYAGGKRFGRHKLDVVASPNKTVEGFVAGVIFAALILPILSLLQVAQPNLLDYAILPVIVGFAGQAGDLLESLMKREAGVKDTSSILPGHGGVLDRFDSLFLSSPLLFAYLLLSSA